MFITIVKIDRVRKTIKVTLTPSDGIQEQILKPIELSLSFHGFTESVVSVMEARSIKGKLFTRQADRPTIFRRHEKTSSGIVYTTDTPYGKNWDEIELLSIIMEGDELKPY